MAHIKEKSWGEMIRNQLMMRKNLPWTPDDQEPVNYVTRHQVSRKEREFDPVLQRYRDKSREENLKREEEQAKRKSLNQSKVKNIQQTCRYNIINHQTNIPGEQQRTNDATLRPKGQNSQYQAGYNIISNIDCADHHFAPPHQRPPRLEPSTPETNTLERPGNKTRDHDFNIISNRYEDAHEVRSREDELRTKKQTAFKYWQTHDFNSLACAYYDPKKEELFQRRRREAETTHGKDHLQRLPPNLRNSEGNFCDIITKQVKDPELMASWNRKHEKSKSKRRVKDIVETKQRERAGKLSQLEETRIMNRVQMVRHKQVHSYEQGYNIINNKSFQGRNGQPVPQLRAQPRKTLWEQIEATKTSNQDKDNTDDVDNVSTASILRPFPTQQESNSPMTSLGSTSVQWPEQISTAPELPAKIADTNHISGVRTGGFQLTKP